METRECKDCVFFEFSEEEAGKEFKESFAKSMGCSPEGIGATINTSKCFVEPEPITGRFLHSIACGKFKEKGEE